MQSHAPFYIYNFTVRWQVMSSIKYFLVKLTSVSSFVLQTKFYSKKLSYVVCLSKVISEVLMAPVTRCIGL